MRKGEEEEEDGRREGREGLWDGVDAFFFRICHGDDTRRPLKSFAKRANTRERAGELLIAHIFSSDVWLARGDKFLRSLTSARLSVPTSIAPSKCIVVNLVGTWALSPLACSPIRSGGPRGRCL